MRLWKVVVLLNIALAVGVGLGHLRWAREVRALQDEVARLEKHARSLFAERMRAARLSSKPMASVTALPLLGQVAVLGLGGWLAANAGSFGFRNLPSEPWHWSTNGN